MTIDLASWMSLLDASKKLNELTIPGTHDSASRFGEARLVTQTRSLGEQLNNGIRFLDIRARYIDGELKLYHESTYQNVTFSEARDFCKFFLAVHDRETIVMSVKEEGEATNNTKNVTFEDRFDQYTNEDPTLWYLASGIPTLEQARGKIVLLRRFAATRTPKGINAEAWQSQNATFTLDGSPKLTIEDSYLLKEGFNHLFDLGGFIGVIAELIAKAVVGGVSFGIKSERVKALLDRASKAPLNDGTLYLDFASSTGPPVVSDTTPRDAANHVNPTLAEYLHNRTQGRYGIVARDFEAIRYPNPTGTPIVNRSVDQTDITRALVRSNLPFGYWILDSNGNVTANGSAVPYPGVTPNAPAPAGAIAIASTRTGSGFWIVTLEGQIHAYGNARVVGGPAVPRGEQATSIAATPAVGTDLQFGYWVLTNRGRVLAHNAPSLPDLTPDHDVNDAVSLVSTPDGNGYWILRASGRVHAFGNAARLLDRRDANQISVAMARTRDGGGYWILALNGRVHAFGNAPNLDDGVGNDTPARAIAATPSGRGYWILSNNGAIHAYGDARNFGRARPAGSGVISVGIAVDSFLPTPPLPKS